jgi:flagellar basal body rod protein FlgB
MNALKEFIEELSSEIHDLEQISTFNKRLSEEKILTKHLVQQVRMLLRIVQLQQDGNEVDAEELIMNYH